MKKDFYSPQQQNYNLEAFQTRRSRVTQWWLDHDRSPSTKDADRT
jgi:hypothetical protein